MSLKLFYINEPSIDGLDVNNSKVWENNSLPLGNGYFGASVFGYVKKERIQITENSLANPYRFYQDAPGLNYGLQSFCDIYLEFNHESYANYYRELSLDKSLFSMSYDVDGINYKREIFTSYVDKILAIRLSATKKESLSLKVKLEPSFIGIDGGHENDGCGKTGITNVNDHEISIKGLMEFYNIEYFGKLSVKCIDGIISSKLDCLEIKNATEVIILFSCGTNYKLNSDVFVIDDPKKKLVSDPLLEVRISKRISESSLLSFDELYQRHFNDYSHLFNRLSLSFGEEESNIPTDKILENYKQNHNSKYLEMLLYQYGRYLLICSSRKGCLPSNLQGIWTCYRSSPWSAGYWHNINIQMNYWPVGPANLLECFESYSDYAVAFQKKAELNATEYINNLYPENLDDYNGWYISTGGWPYQIGGYENKSHSGPGTGGFTSLLFYEYYLFSQDNNYLSEVAYPLVLGMSKFLEKSLTLIDEKYLVKYSASPENVNTETSAWNDYHFTTGCAFDQQMVYDNFKATIELANILHVDSDEFIKKIRSMLPNLDHILIGDSGQIKEYREETYYATFGEKHHRHISQLVGLYPGRSINDSNPEHMKAAEFTLNARGDKSTGWACAHRLCLWSRVKNGNRAMDIIESMLSNNLFDNLWDRHPPFQIDGNFGYVAGVSELLLQSHNGFIELLPALPNKWKDGYFKGLLARGNFTVDVEFKNYKLTKGKIVSNKGKKLVLKNKNYTVKYNETIINENNGYYVIDTQIGDIIEII